MPRSRKEQLGFNFSPPDPDLLTRERRKMRRPSDEIDGQRQSFTAAFFGAMATRNAGLPPELLEAGLEE